MKTRQTVLCGIFAAIFALILALAFAACESPPIDTGIIQTTLTGIDLNTDAVMKTYNRNEQLDLSGLVVTAYYNNRPSMEVFNYITSPADGETLTQTGTIPIEVSYSEGAVTQTASFDIYVTAAASDITYTAEQTGGTDNVTDSAGIVFTFSESVDSLGLTAGDITVSGAASKGTSPLTGTGATRTLAVTVSEAGNATVRITKSGIETATKSVMVYKAGEISPAPILTGITAEYTGTLAIYPDTPLDSLKAYLTVMARYSDNSTKTLSEDEYTLSGTLAVGARVVTVTYQGESASFTVTVATPALSGTINITPSAAVIGTELTANYNGNETGITYQWKKDGANVGADSNKHTPSAIGSYTVTVSATGYESKTSTAVDVSDPSLPTLSGDITISPASAETGTELTANYSGGETGITYQWRKDGANVGTNSNKYIPTETGNYTVTVSATGYNIKTSTAVTVTAPTVTGITLNTNSVKKDYNQNESLNLTGLVVTATYSNGSSAVVNNYTSNPANGVTLSETGEITVTVSYTEREVIKTATFTVTVVGISKIEVTRQPNKTSYSIGETLNITGLEVTATYSDNTTKIVTVTTANITGFDSATAGSKTLTITYNGKEATFMITVIIQLSKIEVTRQPNKTVYKNGEQLDITGLEVTATYSDNTTKIVTVTTANITGFSTSSAGTKTLTVSYTEGAVTRTVTFTITVIMVTKIEITQLPYKIYYMAGETLDITGLVVTATYSDNSTGIAPVTASNITGFNTSTGGVKTLTVTYNSRTATFTITVLTSLTVTNTNEWNAALTTIKNGGNNQGYIINISGNFSVSGGTNTFGTVSNLSVTLQGSGTLSLSSTGSMLHLGANQTLIIDGENLILEGLTNNNTSLVYVSNHAHLELKNGNISGNTATSSSSYSSATGGGVYVAGSFTMSDGNISGNTATSSSGASGGGVFVYADGSFTMSGGKINENTASGSGSIGYANGGGVSVYGDLAGTASPGIFTMTGGTISGNKATSTTSTNASSIGGGVYVSGSGGTFTLAGGTISGNTATATATNGNDSSYGGGVYVSGSGSPSLSEPGIFTMTGGSISGNTATSGSSGGFGGGVAVDGGIFRIVTGTVHGAGSGSLSNTASNSSSVVLHISSISGTAQRGTFNSSGTWVNMGSLSTRNTTLTVLNGN